MARHGREVATGLVGRNRQIEVLPGQEEVKPVLLRGQFHQNSEHRMHEAVQKHLEARIEGAWSR